MKRFSPAALLIIVICSAVPDLVAVLLRLLSESTAIPYNYRDYIKVVLSYPYGGLLFGIVFSAGCSAALAKTARIGFNEIIAMTLLCPLVQLAIPFVIMFLYRILAGFPIPPLIIASFLHALIIAAFAHGLLYIELGAVGIFGTAFFAVALACTTLIPGLPFSPQGYWYFFIGSFLGIFVARQA